MVGIKPGEVQRDFMKYTAQKIKQDLRRNHPGVLTHFKVEAKDREYQFLGKKFFKYWIEYCRDVKTKAGIYSL